MRQRSPAICLRVTDYSETSQVVHFLTREAGVVRLLAKGTKRPKSKSGGAIDLLSEGDLVFIAGGGEALGTLVEFVETVCHADLRGSASALNTALYLIEVTGLMLAAGDPHPEVFDLLHNSLARLGQAGAPVGAVLAYFQWRLLRHVGLLGQLRTCVSCGRPVAGADTHQVAGAGDPAGKPAGDLYFSSSQGGLVCGGCEAMLVEKFRVGGQTLAGLAAVSAAEAGRKVALPDAQALAVNRMLAYHIAQQAGRRVRMARHVLAGDD